MKHVIQQLENQVKSIENLIKHTTNRQKTATEGADNLRQEATGHGDTLVTLNDQRTNLKAAIEGIKAIS